MSSTERTLEEWVVWTLLMAAVIVAFFTVVVSVPSALLAGIAMAVENSEVVDIGMGFALAGLTFGIGGFTITAISLLVMALLEGPSVIMQQFLSFFEE